MSKSKDYYETLDSVSDRKPLTHGKLASLNPVESYLRFETKLYTSSKLASLNPEESYQRNPYKH